MLQDVDSITSRVQALLDDPGGTKYTSTYVLPFIDQEYDEMDVDLELLGMQYVEGVAIFTVSAGITDLTYALASGQPLETMKLPKRMKWKIPGADDTTYLPAGFVTDLDEVSASSEGVLEWKFADGALQITPSAIDVTLKIYYDTVSTNIYDPSQGVIRGTAHILATRTAATIAAVNNGLGTLQKKLDQKKDKAWGAFCTLVVMNDQQKARVPRPIHRRGGGAQGATPSGYL